MSRYLTIPVGTDLLWGSLWKSRLVAQSPDSVWFLLWLAVIIRVMASPRQPTRSLSLGPSMNARWITVNDHRDYQARAQAPCHCDPDRGLSASGPTEVQVLIMIWGRWRSSGIQSRQTRITDRLRHGLPLLFLRYVLPIVGGWWRGRQWINSFSPQICTFPPQSIFYPLFLNEDGRILKTWNGFSKLHHRFRRYSTLTKTVLLESQYLQSYDSLSDFLRPKFEEDRHNFADIEIQAKLS